MTKYIPPVTRKEGTAFGKAYHYYTDGNNNRLDGVTTIIGGGIPKPKLINWAGRATAEKAVDNWDELSELTPIKRLKKLEGIRYEDRDKAAERGTQVHLYAAALVEGIEVPGIPDHLRGHIENYVHFIDSFKLDPIQVEVVVANYTRGYAGTLDLIADLLWPPTGEITRLLLDIKTGATGVFSEAALQLAAYRNAEVYIDRNGDEQPMIEVDGCGVIWCTADDCQLLPVVDEFTIDDDPDRPPRTCFDMFRLAQQVNDYMKTTEKSSLILPALRLPCDSTASIIWNGDT
jgi:hypothetical protein